MQKVRKFVYRPWFFLLPHHPRCSFPNDDCSFMVVCTRWGLKKIRAATQTHQSRHQLKTEDRQPFPAKSAQLLADERRWAIINGDFGSSIIH